VQWDAIVGRALAARGAHVSYLTCGGGRAVCDRVHVWEGPPLPCRTCTGYTHRSLTAHGHEWKSLRGVGGWREEPLWPELDGLDLEQLARVQWRDLPLGELISVPVSWYLCNTALDEDPLARATYRRFLRSGAAIADEIEAALDRDRPDTVLMLNGMFLFEQIARALCAKRGIDVVTYERGYVKGTVFFHRGATASRYDTAQLWPHYRDRPLSDAEARELDAYLAARQVGGRAVHQFWPAPRFDQPEPGFAVMFTNVTWDTAVRGRDRCFSQPREWIVETVRWFAARPEARLIVRAHPAEVRLARSESRELVADVVRAAFPTLPANVVVVEPDDPTSSYPLMNAADVALVYTSTAGMEAALVGTPCITAGDTQFGAKGFTLDPVDRDAYFDALGEVTSDPRRFAPDVELARRYAYFFFFRAALRSERWVNEPIAGLARITDDPTVLAPGGDPDLDVICRGILEGTPFLRDDRAISRMSTSRTVRIAAAGDSRRVYERGQQ
jgi:hypothetical protein